MLHLGECQSLVANNLPYVYLSPVQNPPPSNDGYFIFVLFGVRQAQIFGCACPKRKCAVVWLFGGDYLINGATQLV